MYSLSERGKYLKKNANIDKYIVIYITLILILSTVTYYIFNSVSDIEVFYYLDDFKLFNLIEIIMVFIFLIYGLRNAMKEVFKEKDIYRKIFISFNFIYLAIYALEKVYLYVNLDSIKILRQ